MNEPLKKHGDKFATPVPFDLTTHLAKSGFALGKGQLWHRDDFTEEMLLPGMRPLLLRERFMYGDQIWRKVGWAKMGDESDDSVGSLVQATHYHTRTTRPLPPAPATAKKSLQNIVQGIVSERIRFTLDADTLDAVVEAITAPLKAEIERLKEQINQHQADVRVQASNSRYWQDKFNAQSKLLDAAKNDHAHEHELRGEALKRAESAESRVTELEASLEAETAVRTGTIGAMLAVLDEAEVETHHPDVGAPARKPFMPHERVACLVNERDTLRAQLATAQDDERKKCVDLLHKEIKAYADNQYCAGCDMTKGTECLGWEYKALNGKFGKPEFKAHKEASELFGNHYGAMHILNKILPVILTPHE